MTSRAERRRRRHARAVERFHALAQAIPANEPDPPTSEPILRPTDERMRQGVWHIAGKAAPAVDRTGGDMLGELFIAGQIEKHHYDAGRNFQQLVAAFMADLGIGGYRSCLDISGGGYDASDGNVSVAQEYERTKRRLGAVRFLYLRTELAKPVGAKCNSVEMLRKALDSLGNY